MSTILEKYSGGPVGLNTIAASIDEEPDTIEEVYEPYLIQMGFIDTHAARPGGHRPGLRVLRPAAPPARQPPEHAVLMKTVYLSLGSNLGDREGYLRRAIALIGARGGACPAPFFALRDRAAGSARPAPVPEPGGGGGDGTVP